MTVSEVTKLKNLKDENAKLKGLVAEFSPENPVRKVIDHIQKHFKLSQRQICKFPAVARITA